MTPRLRKLALTAHITSSVGWLGAVAGFLPFAVAVLTSQDAQRVRAAYLAMELIGWFILVPLALASLLTGLVVSLGSTWGLFQHYWVLAKFVITVLATIILLKYMQTLGYLAGVAAGTTSSSADHTALQIPTHVVHAGAALLALLVATTLSVYKPWGLTRYGRRKQNEQRTVSQRPYPDSIGDTGMGRGRGSTTSTPRWVYVFEIIVIVLVLLFVIKHLAGDGLGGHTP